MNISLPDAAVLMAIALSFWAAFLLAANFVAKRVIRYRIADYGFEVVAFEMIVLSRVRCEDITAIEVMSWGRLVWLSLYTRLFWAARAGNNLVARRVVVISRRRGAGRTLIISPDDPDLFVGALQERCRRSATNRGSANTA